MEVKAFAKTIYTYFYNWNKILRFKKFGKDSFLGRRCTLHLAGDGIYIGDGVRIGNDARISLYQAKGHRAYVEIRDGAYFGSNLSILTADKVVIEENVLMASYINILGENHSMDPKSSLTYGMQPLMTAPVTIKKGCWIGQNVTILGGKTGITIGEKSIVGACSVVTKNVPPYSIVAGNPAKVIKTYNFEKSRWENVT